MSPNRLVRDEFASLLDEIDEYLVFLRDLKKAVASGPPRIVSRLVSTEITARQQRMMYSSVYVQLYNLVESTFVLCLDEVASTVAGANAWKATDLAPLLRQEWIRYVARTHDTNLKEDRRFAASVRLFDHVAKGNTITQFKIARPTKNWDDDSILAVIKRFGMDFTPKASTTTLVKRNRGNGLGALAYVKQLRNDLAHGVRSFSDCSQGVSVTDLTQLRDAVAIFLKELVQATEDYLNSYEYLEPLSRPAVGALPANFSPSTNDSD